MKQVVVRRADPNLATLVSQAMESEGCEVFAIVPMPLVKPDILTVWGRFLIVEDMDIEARIAKIDAAIEEALFD